VPDILFRNAPTAIAITAHYQHALVFQRTSLVRTFDQLCKGRVALNDMCRVQWYVQLLADLCDAFRLVFTTAVGEEDEGNALLFEEA
jgi:hypothetical protein